MKPDTHPHLAMHRKALGAGESAEMVGLLLRLEACLVKLAGGDNTSKIQEELELQLRLVRDCIEMEQGRGK